MANRLINKHAVREYILRRVAETRPSLDFTRVAPTVYDDLEYYLRNKINKMVHSHPSVGKTFNP